MAAALADDLLARIKARVSKEPSLITYRCLHCYNCYEENDICPACKKCGYCCSCGFMALRRQAEKSLASNKALVDSILQESEELEELEIDFETCSMCGETFDLIFFCDNCGYCKDCCKC